MTNSRNLSRVNLHPELQYGVPYLKHLIESVNLYDLKVWDYEECEIVSR